MSTKSASQTGTTNDLSWIPKPIVHLRLWGSSRQVKIYWSFIWEWEAFNVQINHVIRKYGYSIVVNGITFSCDVFGYWDYVYTQPIIFIYYENSERDKKINKKNTCLI